MAGDTVICAGCTEAALRLDLGEMQADDDQTLRLVLRPSSTSSLTPIERMVRQVLGAEKP